MNVLGNLGSYVGPTPTLGYFEKKLLNTLDVSSINLGSALIFASCVINYILLIQWMS